MTRWSLAMRGAMFRWRTSLGVMLGVAVAAAVLTGALAVGDSARQTLRDQSMARIGHVRAAIAAGDRFFRAALADDLRQAAPGAEPAAVLSLRGVAGSFDGSMRVNNVQVLGVDGGFVPLFGAAEGESPEPGEVWLSAALARRLSVSVGQELLLRVEKPSALPRDVVIARVDDASLGVRVRVSRIVGDEHGGRFSLQAGPLPPLNALVDRDWLARQIDQVGRANVMVVGEGSKPSAISRQPSGAGEQESRRAGEQESEVSGQRSEVSEANRRSGADHRQLTTDHRQPSTDNRQPLSTQHSAPSTSLPALDAALHHVWTLEDAELELIPRESIGQFEIRSRRIFLDGVVEEAARELEIPTLGVLTYFVNELRLGGRMTPYSMVSAIAPLSGGDTAPGLMQPLDASLANDALAVSAWLAEDLEARVGDDIELRYYTLREGRELEEAATTLRVSAIVPMEGLAIDRDLMPEFPGIADAESSRDWEPGVPIHLERIRPKDERYWDDFRGAPKAFVSLATGQRLWSNRFGTLTAIRAPIEQGERLAAELRTRLDPASFGLSFRDLLREAEQTGQAATDLGGLFIGLSMFLVVASLLLASLLFVFSIEQRSGEIGSLLAIGWRRVMVTGLMLREAVLVVGLGVLLGSAAGVGYALLVLELLGSIWSGAVADAAITPHIRVPTLIVGAGITAAMSLAAIVITLRGRTNRSPVELLAISRGSDGVSALARGRRPWSRWVALAAGLGAIGLLIVGFRNGSPGALFGAGTLVVIALLSGVRAWLAAAQRRGAGALRSLAGLGLRNAVRRPGRSMATAALLSTGVFLVLSVSAYRLGEVRDPADRRSGTGGFALFGVSTLPVYQDLGTERGQATYAIDPRIAREISIVSLRVREGDEASCLNLGSAARPRLAGVRVDDLARRGAFTFAAAPTTADGSPWDALSRQEPDRAIPAIGDEASVLWSLHKRVGDTLEMPDEQGRPIRIRIVGTVRNSILQGLLLIDERAFERLYPSETGSRMFLVDAPIDRRDEVARSLTRSLADVGLELERTDERLANFNRVQNTYLIIFQALGGLGLVLGTAGLGVVVLRNLLDRRREVAMLRAVGYRASIIRRLIVGEHAGLLLVGMGCGLAGGLLAGAPAAARGEIPWLLLTGLIGGMVIVGLSCVVSATRVMVRGDLVRALQSE